MAASVWILGMGWEKDMRALQLHSYAIHPSLSCSKHRAMGQLLRLQLKDDTLLWDGRWEWCVEAKAGPSIVALAGVWRLGMGWEEDMTTLQWHSYRFHPLTHAQSTQLWGSFSASS